MGPVNALSAYQMLSSGKLLPIHRGTFNLAIHPWSEPAETFLRQGSSADVPLVMPKLGAPVEPALADGVDGWWRTVASAAPEPLADSEAPESQAPMEQLVD